MEIFDLKSDLNSNPIEIVKSRIKPDLFFSNSSFILDNKTVLSILLFAYLKRGPIGY